MRVTKASAAFLLVTVAALVVAANAVAQPRLVVSQQGARVTITVRQRATDTQPARVAVFVPPLYRLRTTQPAGTVIGSASGNFFLRDANDQPQLVSGDITVAPASTSSPATCAAGTHSAVWMLNLTGRSLKMQVPLFVSRARGTELRYGGQRLLLCFGPADVAQGTAGRSPNGAQLLRLSMTFNGVFTAPIGGPFAWKSLSTPFVPGSANVGTAATVESRAFVGPAAIAFRVQLVSRRSHTYRLAGRVTVAGQPAAAASVRLTVNGRVRFTAITRQSGTFSIVRRVAGRGLLVFRARAVGGARDVTAVGCSKSTLAGVACVSAMTNPYQVLSRLVRVHA